MASTCLIFLHGSGSDGDDIRTYLDTVPLPDFENRTFTQVSRSLSVTVHTITAPSRPYSPFGGELSTVWFDRSPFFQREGMNDTEDSVGVEASLDLVMKTAERVKDRYSHIFIGGFSMGGGLALHALRRNGPANLRGVFSMGSFAVNRSALVQGALGSNASLPVLMMHGEALIFHGVGNVSVVYCYVRCRQLDNYVCLHSSLRWLTETLSVRPARCTLRGQRLHDPLRLGPADRRQLGAAQCRRSVPHL